MITCYKFLMTIIYWHWPLIMCRGMSSDHLWTSLLTTDCTIPTQLIHKKTLIENNQNTCRPLLKWSKERKHPTLLTVTIMNYTVMRKVRKPILTLYQLVDSPCLSLLRALLFNTNCLSWVPCSGGWMTLWMQSSHYLCPVKVKVDVNWNDAPDCHACLISHGNLAISLLNRVITQVMMREWEDATTETSREDKTVITGTVRKTLPYSPCLCRH